MRPVIPFHFREVKAEDSEFKAGLSSSLLHSFIVVLVMEARSFNVLHLSSQCGPFSEALVGVFRRQEPELVGGSVRPCAQT